MRFQLSGFSGDAPLALVLGSLVPGTLPLNPFGDSRDLGLTLGGVFLAFLNNPTLSLATLDGTGSGSTTPLLFDAPVGFSLYVAAVSLDPFAAALVSKITDVEHILITP